MRLIGISFEISFRFNLLATYASSVHFGQRLINHQHVAIPLAFPDILSTNRMYLFDDNIRRNYVTV